MIKHGAILSSLTTRFTNYNLYSSCRRTHFTSIENIRPLSKLLGSRKPPLIFSSSRRVATMAKAKRKSSSVAQTATEPTYMPTLALVESIPPPPKRRASQRTQVTRVPPSRTNPDTNADVLDGPEALRASPDAEEKDERLDFGKVGLDAGKQIKDVDNDVPSLTGGDSDSSLSEMSDMESPVKQVPAKNTSRSAKVKVEATGEKVTMKSTSATKAKEPQFLDPEAEGEEEANEEEIQAALSRPPPVHSDYLPLPWKGRLGYVSFRSCTGCC